MMYEEFIEVDAASGCHIWKGPSMGGRRPVLPGHAGVSARRELFKATLGLIDENDCILSSCKNKLCVNVDHMTLSPKNRLTCGICSTQLKLTPSGKKFCQRCTNVRNETLAKSEKGRDILRRARKKNYDANVEARRMARRKYLAELKLDPDRLAKAKAVRKEYKARKRKEKGAK